MEIERKFLVKRDDAFRKEVSSSSVIAQGYMDVKGATVRIRLRDDKAYLTINGGNIEAYSKKDDAVNATRNITINGGTYYVHSDSNDGTDSNGTGSAFWPRTRG